MRGAPIDPVARRLWGVPMVLNQGLGNDVGLVIAQDAVTVDYDGAVKVKSSDAVSDDFANNQVRCRVGGLFGVSVNPVRGLGRRSSASPVSWVALICLCHPEAIA